MLKLPKFSAKLLQKSGMAKKIQIFFAISECSVSYEKLLQKSGMAKKNCNFA